MKKIACKKTKKIVLISLLTFLVVFIGLYSFYRHIEVNPYIESDFVHAIGNKMYDKNNKEFKIEGINIGNWLVPEGWMGVSEISNINGSFTYKKMLKALEDNPNIKDEDIDGLLDTYYSNYFTEEDVKYIKNAGFNTIRVPFGYFNLYDSLGKLKNNAYKYLDQVINWCKNNDLYVILDCHAASVSQNGEHHSGDEGKSIFFESEEEQEKTIKMWEGVASRYLNETIVIGYDLLNEASGNTKFATAEQNDVIRKIYERVRAVDKNHIIFIEAIWTFLNIANPYYYGYENVVYELHYYNIMSHYLSDKSYIFMQEMSYLVCSFRNVPIYIGEFGVNGDYENVCLFLDWYDKHNWGWSSWTYKTNNSGNWGMFNLYKDMVDLSTATYDEIYNSWSDVKTDYNNLSDGGKNLIKYLKEN